MYQANNSRANILVVEDEKQLGKIMQIRSELTHLKAIVQYQGTPTQEVRTEDWRKSGVAANF